jgi:hypothetical protein
MVFALGRIARYVLQRNQARSKGGQAFDDTEDALLVKVFGQESHEVVIADGVVAAGRSDMPQ